MIANNNYKLSYLFLEKGFQNNLWSAIKRKFIII